MRGRPLHHVALTPRDWQASQRFYQDGLGLEPIADLPGLEGDWKHLFDGPSNELRSIFFGSPDHTNAGVVELVVFGDDDPSARREAAFEIVNGFFLLSFYVDDVDETIDRLEQLGVCREPKRTTLGHGEHAFTVGTVRDPDGTLVELVGRPADRGLVGPTPG
jgi:catechol 2,3-dioxygenase-like lactoylglutathione lyase family enzyme